MSRHHRASPSLREAATLLVLFAILPTTGCKPLSPTSDHTGILETTRKPSSEEAWSRGPQVFNAVHNAMRQWGSSLHHNGMSFFIAHVPEGVLLHHGNDRPITPLGYPEWLSFEIEHAEQFALRREKVETVGGLSSNYHDDQPSSASLPPFVFSGGYLHTYRTTRTLPFLYVDGMSAAKSRLGTMDSQDYILRDIAKKSDVLSATTRETFTGQGEDLDGPAELKKRFQASGLHPGPQRRTGQGRGNTSATDSFWDERTRAAELCTLAQSLGLEGVIRMEAGFEVIKCDFSTGLKEVQALKRPNNLTDYFGTGGPQGMSLGFGTLEYLRGMEERYGGIGAGRVKVDYSSMVSALFFEVNLTNPDASRSELPRLTDVPHDELIDIRSYLKDSFAERLYGAGSSSALGSIDWQGLSDMIVGRYADRIRYMAEGVTSLREMAQEVRYLLTAFIEFPDAQDSARQDKQPNLEDATMRCSKFYLRSIPLPPDDAETTQSDSLIAAAFKRVSGDICSALFQVYQLTDIPSNHQDQAAILVAAKAIARKLMFHLQWTRFKQCRPGCGLGEVCAIPMFPMGTIEQYRSPKCVKESGGDPRKDDGYYWK